MRFSAALAWLLARCSGLVLYSLYPTPPQGGRARPWQPRATAQAGACAFGGSVATQLHSFREFGRIHYTPSRVFRRFVVDLYGSEVITQALRSR